MGLPTNERDELFRQTFSECVTFTYPKGPEAPVVVICDFMMFVKSLPEDLHPTKHDVIGYFVNRVKNIMFSNKLFVTRCVVMVDGATDPVKKVVAHAVRYKNKDVLSSKRGPYMPKSDMGLMPTPWISFAGNQKLLRRELYPELFNAFMSCRFTPKPGQALILSGFPGRTHLQHTQADSWDQPIDVETGDAICVKLWDVEHELPITEAMERQDPHLYHRSFIVEHVAPCPEFPAGVLRVREEPRFASDISEADLRMFWFERFFPDANVIFLCNDGDALTIGAAYAKRRFLGIGQELNPKTGAVERRYQFRGSHVVCMPYKKADKQGLFQDGQRPEYEFFNLDILYQSICEYAPFHGIVQDEVATLMFLVIMSRTDFFQNFLTGMTSKTIIRPCFLENIELFTHLIQVSKGNACDLNSIRQVVIDEDAFELFIYYCYLYKHEEVVLKKSKGDKKISFEQLRAKTLEGKNGAKDEYQLPTRNKIRMWCRQVEYNMRYWLNGPVDHAPNPFEMWFDVPYYPYQRNEQTGKPEKIDHVSPRPKPVDEVFAQHLLERKQERGKNRKRTRSIKQNVVSEFEHVLAKK